MLTSIISLLGGGLLRLAPELFAWLNKRTDHAHELAMIDRQVALENVKNAGRLQEIQALGANAAASDASLAARETASADAAQALAAIEAHKVALGGQMQQLGITWVDALNFLVRPLATYYFLGCYGIVKSAMIVVAVRAVDPLTAVVQCWNGDDAATLSGILGFWFVGRVFDKKK